MERRTRLAALLAAAALVVFTGVGATTHATAPAAPARSAHAPAKSAAKSTAEAAASKPSEAATRPWPGLMQGNKRFVAGEHLVHPVRELREELANGQHPDVIVLTCSDSRLSPEWIFDQTLGELFVVRTAGNVVDPIALGSIEYAVEHLHAKLIVVMGHDKCGAVSAALSGETMPTDNLDTIMRKIRPGIPPARTGASKDETLDAAVRANVRRSATDVVVASPIVREHVVQGSVSVVQAVYHLASGQVEELRTSDQLSESDHD